MRLVYGSDMYRRRKGIMRTVVAGVLACTAVLITSGAGSAVAGPDVTTLGPAESRSAVAASGTIYVTDFDHKQILAFPPGGGSSRIVATVSDNPWGIAVSPDGQWLFVTEPGDGPSSGTVVALPTAGGDPEFVASGLWWPHGIAVSADGHTLYVAENGINGDIVELPTAFDPDSPPHRIIEHVRYAETVAALGSDVYYAGNTGEQIGNVRGVWVHNTGRTDQRLCDTGYATGLAVTPNGDVYAAVSIFETPGNIRAFTNKRGTNCDGSRLVTTGLPELGGVAIRDDTAYVVEAQSGTVRSVPVQAHDWKAEPFAEAGGPVHGIAVQP